MPFRLAAPVIKHLYRDPAAVTGCLLAVLIVLCAIFAPALAPSNPNTVDRSRMNEAPRWISAPAYEKPKSTADTLLGRDVRGRDVLSRVVYGARTSLLVGLLVVTIAAVIGVSLGCVAGYAGGFVDAVIMRLVDILLAFPFLILALAMVSIFPRATIWHIALILGITYWPGICRLTRGQVLATRGKEYVKAAQAIGAGHGTVLFRHILPNCMAPVIIWFAMGIAGAIMGEASLSFLGLGDPESLSWGTMIYMGLSRSDFPAEWWAAVFPALALAATVLAFNLLGDALQDALDPRIRR